MLNRKYRAGVAAVLVWVVLFSPLLCGMTCRERLRVGPEAVQTVAPAAELTGEFVKSAVAGCVLTNLVSRIDFSGWSDGVDIRTWVWVGAEAVRLVGAVRL